MARLVTKEGFKKLQDELEERKTTVRQKIAGDIKEAKDQGDLSENAEYTEAKSQQSENESRIAELEMIIKDSEVVEQGNNGDGVGIGSKVKVRFNGSEQIFEIVGSNESDPASFKISNESPLGKAFIGKKSGDETSVETPTGKMKYAILEVS